MLIDNIKREKYPLIFFGVVVSIKLYFLIDFLSVLIGGQAVSPNPEAVYPLGQYLFVSYSLVSILFDFIVFLTFLLRHEATHKPAGFSENVFPLIVVFLPVVGFTLLNIPQVRQAVPAYSEQTLMYLYQLSPQIPLYINLTGLTIGFCGALFSIWAILYLNRSFGLRVAVRKFINKGPYRMVRHPLYVGEIVHILGIAILSATPVGLWLFLVSVLLQIVRARLEERKFIEWVPEYSAYRRNTGFFVPKLSRLKALDGRGQP